MDGWGRLMVDMNEPQSRIDYLVPSQQVAHTVVPNTELACVAEETTTRIGRGWGSEFDKRQQDRSEKAAEESAAQQDRLPLKKRGRDQFKVDVLKWHTVLDSDFDPATRTRRRLGHEDQGRGFQEMRLQDGILMTRQEAAAVSAEARQQARATSMQGDPGSQPKQAVPFATCWSHSDNKCQEDEWLKEFHVELFSDNCTTGECLGDIDWEAFLNVSSAAAQAAQ